MKKLELIINNELTIVTIRRQLRGMPGDRLQTNYSAKAVGFSQRVLFKDRCHSMQDAIMMLRKNIKNK